MLDIGCIEGQSPVSESVLGLARVISEKFEALNEQFDRENGDALVTKSIVTAEQTKTALESYIGDAQNGRKANTRQLEELKRNLEVDRQALQRALDWPNQTVIVEGKKVFVVPPSRLVRCSWIRVVGQLVNDQGQPVPFDVERDKRMGVSGTNAYFLCYR